MTAREVAAALWDDDLSGYTSWSVGEHDDVRERIIARVAAVLEAYAAERVAAFRDQMVADEWSAVDGDGLDEKAEADRAGE